MSDNVRMAKGTDRRDERITIRVPAAVRVVLEREAAAQRRSLSDLILIFIEQGLGTSSALGSAKRKGGR